MVKMNVQGRKENNKKQDQDESNSLEKKKRDNKETK